MPINADYEYFEAEKQYFQAQTPNDKILALEEMIRKAPKHKGAENLLAELKTRLKKLREKSDKISKSSRSKRGIKKENYQVVLVGITNSGKSALLSALTNAKPVVSSTPFTTKHPALGTMDYDGVKVQIVDMPSIGSSFFDIGIVNNADCLLLVIDKFDDLQEINKYILKNQGRKIIVFNKIDLLNQDEKRKLEERFRSKRLNYVLVSVFSGEGIDNLKKIIFEGMHVIRVYMKEPGKVVSGVPVILPEGSTVKDVAESIFQGFSSKIKETRITGPSAKFAKQKVGLFHILKDRDIVEFHTY